MEILLHPENDQIYLTTTDFEVCSASDESIENNPYIHIQTKNSYQYAAIKLDKIEYINEILTDIPEKEFEPRTRGEIYHGSIYCVFSTKNDTSCVICDSAAVNGSEIILLGTNSPWIHRDCRDEFLEIINRVENYQDEIAANML